MKLNLLFNNPADVRSGYVNVDPMATNPLVASLDALDPVVDDGEAEEIVAYDILDQCPNPLPMLAHWITKLKHDGELTVSGLDLLEVSKAFSLRQLTIGEANQYLYGPNKEKRGAATMQNMVDLLEKKGLQVIKKRNQNRHYYVTARRP